MTDQIEVIETEEFQKAAADVLSAAELDDLITYLSQRPDAGALLPESHGCRYVRWAAKGHGKGRGGRIVYYFGGMDMPLFLLDAYFKGKRAGIDRPACRRYAALATTLIAEYKKRRD